MKRIVMLAVLIVLTVAAVAGQSFAFENVDPATAYAMVTTDPNVYVLDVRTPYEWQWVGHPGKNKLGEGAALAGKVVNIAYEIDYKGSLVVNPSFLTDVAEIFSKDSTVITVCRSGARSARAAADLELAGYHAVNMVTGFEGATDAKGYRTVNGWKVLNLPYTFSGTGYAD